MGMLVLILHQEVPWLWNNELIGFAFLLPARCLENELQDEMS